jgi:REP element-mobilizing transposase RayT
MDAPLGDIPTCPLRFAHPECPFSMCRFARVVLPGSPHHITQRGIRRFDIFRDDKDRELYFDLFVESSRRFGLSICAYCLMTNHIHFVAIPKRKDVGAHEKVRFF